MFEKFTERARRVMGLARQEAQRLNSEFIGTEHIILGIIKEDGGVAAKTLKALSVTGQAVEDAVKKLITPAAVNVITLGQLPFSPRAKRVIELAAEWASKFGHDVIGTEHLLLGLIQENEGIAAQVLVNLGVSLEAAKLKTLEILGAAEQSTDLGHSRVEGIKYLKSRRAELMRELADVDAGLKAMGI